MAAAASTTSNPNVNTGPQEACKTYIEQTKLLVTLASAAVAAPVALIPLIAGKAAVVTPAALDRVLWFEGFFLASILAGYVVLGTIAGSQHDNAFNVHRRATRISSFIQIGCYLMGLYLFVVAARFIALQPAPGPSSDVSRLEIFRLDQELPPFDSGSATQTAGDLRDAICKARQQLAATGTTNVLVVGRHDAMPLSPSARRTFGSNMGLSTERAATIETMLRDAVACPTPPLTGAWSVASGPRNAPGAGSPAPVTIGVSAEDRKADIYGARFQK